MDLSLIIATSNNCDRLAITLNALCALKVPADLEWELVLVNNNCTDRTHSVVREFTSRLPLLYLEEPVQGLSVARNTGVRHATGRLAVFTDDDIKPAIDWLAVYWSSFREKGDGFFFGGPLRSEFEEKPPSEKLLSVSHGSVKGVSFGDRPRLLESQEHFMEGNWAVPTTHLRSLDGFNPRLGLNPASTEFRTGEGFDLQDRLVERGIKGWHLPNAQAVHFVPRKKCTLLHAGNRAEAHGNYMAYLFKQHGYPRRGIDLRTWCLRRGVGIERYLVDVDTSGPLLAGVPWRLYPVAGSRWLRWLACRLSGSDQSVAYTSMRFYLGAIKRLHRYSREREHVQVEVPDPPRRRT